MIVGKLAVTDDDKKIIRGGMPRLGVADALICYGFFDNNKCVGGMYLCKQYPYDLVIEFYTKCPTIIKAFSNGFGEFFKIKTCLTASIDVDNSKSLKMVKMFGFNRLYVSDNKVRVEFRKENWRYEKRHPIRII